VAAGLARVRGANLVGAGLTCVSSIMIEFWPFVVLDAMWALVALAALLQARPRSGGLTRGEPRSYAPATIT
jgi:uncharacterized membrane protein